MSIYSDIYDAVVTITNKPALTNEIALAISRATLKEHAAIDYPQDLRLSNVIPLTDIGTNTFKYNLNLTSVITDNVVRKIKTIREVDDASVLSGQYNILAASAPAYLTTLGYTGLIEFEEVATDAIFDSYGVSRQDIYVRYGDNITLSSARRAVENIGIVYYAMPKLTTDDTYNSWIAQHYPHVIYEHAAYEIFRMIGKSDEMSMYLAKLADNRMDVIKAQISGVG